MSPDTQSRTRCWCTSIYRFPLLVLCVEYAPCPPLIVLSVRSWRTLQLASATNFCVAAECIFCGICPVLTSDCSVCQILKDITTHYKLLCGCRVYYVWDMPSAYLWLFWLSDPEGHYNPLEISVWMQSVLCVRHAQCLPLIVLSVRSWRTLQPATKFCVDAGCIFCGICPVLTSDWLIVLSVRS